ncbi:molybdopterin biosynthesis protein [Phosphitispora fastidiosa]|uniref:molybdopterin biosynthesis protein n=1 Tax=Phosphitispora fastidiosa TaxID=2837202 RepID=UPI003EB6BBA5|nr:putative molybdopterin biosynthesis protein [Phosphitispora fastidiosa]
MKRNVYLDNTPLEEAVGKYSERLSELDALKPLPGELIAVDEAQGRVTAEPVFAQVSSPHYHACAMDGMAVKAENTFKAGETNPVRLKVGSRAFPVDTGDPLPEGCDAVIMIEQVHFAADGEIEIIAAAAPWQHVRPLGEDIVATEMIVPANHVLRSMDIGGILAGGVTEVKVHRQPVVTVMPTGTELVQPGTDLKKGDIIEYNSRIIGGLVREWGGQAVRTAINADEYDILKEQIRNAVEQSDIVVVNAGSSAGSEDFTSAIIRELGEVVVHGVAIKPGKPVVLGVISGKPVLGIPGYPVSAILDCELFLRPVIAAKAGISIVGRPVMNASLSRKLVSPQGVDEFVRVKLGRVGEKVIATPISRGAGVLTSLIRADGILKIPRFMEGHDAGSEVEVELLRDKNEIENTMVIIGSHDVSLDILGNSLRQMYPGRSLSSAHVGSLGGLLALRRGEAHLAGVHLLDEATGEYNAAYVEKLLAGVPVILINLVYREQGFMVPRGNPRSVRSFVDLARPNMRFINRQKGAGTRILLDYYLKKEGVDPEDIEGYDREDYTHMAVAAAVAGGSADVGLGIRAAANALKLDFVPVTEERYDLVIPQAHWDTDHIKSLLGVLNDPDFRTAVEGLGGYSTRAMGQEVYRRD